MLQTEVVQYIYWRSNPRILPSKFLRSEMKKKATKWKKIHLSFRRALNVTRTDAAAVKCVVTNDLVSLRLNNRFSPIANADRLMSRDEIKNNIWAVYAKEASQLECRLSFYAANDDFLRAHKLYKYFNWYYGYHLMVHKVAGWNGKNSQFVVVVHLWNISFGTFRFHFRI